MLSAQGVTREPVGRAQNDASPFHLPLRRGPRAKPLLERFPVAAAQFDPTFRVCHAPHIQPDDAEGNMTTATLY